jgi:hypothetical protein
MREATGMSMSSPRVARSAVLLLAVVLPLASGGWASRRASLERRPKRVAISGVMSGLSKDTAFAARIAMLDSLVDAAVRRQGFAVIPHDTVDALAKWIADSAGGPFDPVTGKRDSARTDSIDTAVRRAIVARLGADLWLQPMVIFETVPFWGGEAKWRGTAEKTGAMGGVGAIVLGTKSGRIPALSLLVLVEDSTGRPVFGGGGGIQLIMKANGFAKKPTEIPMDSLLADRARNEQAVRYALDSLATRVGVDSAIAARPEP